MTLKKTFSSILCLFVMTMAWAQSKIDYTAYHQKVLEIEQLIASENYSQALTTYEQLFKTYDFVFRRDYQIASQLAAYTKDKEKTHKYIELGILGGWKLKYIKNKPLFKQFLTKEDWKVLKRTYPSLRKQYEEQLQKNVREQVKKMSSKDQWKALKALFRFSDKAQTRYAETKFAPHSEQQIAKLQNILTNYGYPGEKHVGNGVWMSTIISHHNSISTAYNRKDTLYKALRPQLQEAIQKGTLSPYQFAIIDDWYRTSINDDQTPTYGIINPPKEEEKVSLSSLYLLLLKLRFTPSSRAGAFHFLCSPKENETKEKAPRTMP